MTSKERILAALRLEEPDRVPVTLYEMSEFAPGWACSEPSYARVLKAQTELGDNFVFTGVDMGTGVADPNAIHTHTYNDTNGMVRETKIDTPLGPLTTLSRRDPGNVTTWTLKHYIETPEDIEKYLSLPVKESAPDASVVLKAKETVGDSGIVVIGPGDPIGLAVGMMDFEFFAIQASTDPAPIRALTDRLFEILRRNLTKLCMQVDEVCFRFWGPEYCGAPLVNPSKLFPEFVVRYDKELCRIANQSGNFSIIHCHGRLKDIMDYIAEMEPSALEPLEVLPNRNGDVTMAELKERLGSRVCLMGGIQGQDLELASKAELRSRVYQCMEEGKPGGGYVMLPTSAPFRAPLPPELERNILIYFEAGREVGAY